ncbi:iron dicitrate transport regulator FecR [Leptospira semungkisensis]|uniref:Iron dicitrate transport regulator FecR n=1 Tax=Leptospira semungkisensis TaxID=2484985 RepID=A0A4R9G623_9LEPT|nr:FecR family protein [Leptospira semungkisensis]TGK07036.1 iron dicitrate transport regulator FecR [Leptospira semungkisensis]
MKSKILSLHLLLCISFIVLGSCSKISQILSPSKSKPGLVVIFVNGGVQVQREGNKIQIKIGDILQRNDEIITNNGSIDLQSSYGHTIRLKSFTRLSIESLHGELNEETSLAVKTGQLLIKANKLSSKESFRVSTPTAIAAVRGTAFSFEVVEGTLPRIKVYEGMVAMTLKSPISKEITAEDIAKNPNLKRFEQFLKENEVIISEKEEAVVKPAYEELIQAILTQVDKKTIEQSINEFQEDVLKKAVSKKNFNISPQEEADLQTLVKVKEELIDSDLEKKEGVEVSSQIQKDQSEKLNQAFDKIESVAKDQNLESEGEIQKYYSVLETVRKVDDTELSGAVVTQVGDTILLHSTEGIFRLNTSQIKYIEYKNFDLVTKKKKK